MLLEEFAKRLNEWGSARIPFLFLVDFEMEKPVAYQLDELSAEKLVFDLNGFSNAPPSAIEEKAINFKARICHTVCLDNRTK